MRIKNKKIIWFFDNFRFKSLNLNFSKQLTILWSIMWFISLFLPWIKDVENLISWNAFNSISWNIWFLLIIILLIPIFVTLSTNYKEKIKLYSDLSLKNHFMIITSWFFVISLLIDYILFLNILHIETELFCVWHLDLSY